MKVVVATGAVHPDTAPYDAAERKGIGHPDSLADLVADVFSRKYSLMCTDRFGAVPNHWVDKVNLVGASSQVRFGGFSIDKPVDCYLFGKVTTQVGDQEIDLGGTFRKVVEEVLPVALGDDSIVDHLRTHVNNTRGSAVDHDREFYAPRSQETLRRVLSSESVANDTVICTGVSCRGMAGRIATWLEALINATDFRDRFPMVGTDVKVMVVRLEQEIDVTAAVPVHPWAVTSWKDYRDQLAYVEAALTGELKAYLGGVCQDTVRLRVNTKDSPGRAYLAPFGTSLGKGDCGAVGRGNRSSGVIEPLRPSGCEAPAGKNPVHHGGKIYTALAREAARRIQRELGHYAEVTIAARNGEPLDAPAFVLVTLPESVKSAERSRAEQIATATAASASGFCAGFLQSDPLTDFHRQAADER